MQDRVQLNREEIVGDGTALSNINPITNTQSVDDPNTGESLDVTIERIWKAINNKLARIVNSVNGKDGVVVLTAEDIGLGDVTNVSFSTIKDWVIDEILSESEIKRLKLFDTYEEFTHAYESWLHDKAYANVPFYIRIGGPGNDTRAWLGYTYWDNDSNTVNMMPINVINHADNTIIYNELINSRDYTGGRIGVNIWTGEDALHVHAPSDSKPNSGLAIDKDKIAPKVRFFNGLYGEDDSENDETALIYNDNGYTPADQMKKLRININGVQIGGIADNLKTCCTFKKNDIIVSNFVDTNYRNPDGTLKANINNEFVCRETMIGQVTDVPIEGNVNTAYVIDFHPLKPHVGMGLKYYNVHTSQAVQSSMIGLDLLTNTYGVTNPVQANVSGINAFNDINRTSIIADNKQNYTVMPNGEYQTGARYTNAAFISPDYSLNVIPYNVFNHATEAPLENWPAKVPHLSDVDNQTFFGVNLLKRMAEDTNHKMNAFNMSGLRIIDGSETVYNSTIGKSDNDTSDKFDTNAGAISGGLMVNVGKFLEIGTNVGDDAEVYNKHGYYAGGKVNVRVYQKHFDDADNRLRVKLSHYTKLDGTEPNMFIGGGLAYSTGFDLPSYPDAKCTSGIAINRGLGLRMSRYNNRGEIPKDYYYNLLTEEPVNFDATNYYKLVDGEYVQGSAGEAWAVDTWYYRGDNEVEDHGFLAASIVDPLFLPDDFDDSYEPDDPNDPYSSKHEQIMSTYGGLRYMLGPPHSANSQSSIGLRVNTYESPYGHELRLGQRAIGINEDNVVGLQLYRESDSPSLDSNPLIIKGWDEASLYKYIKMPWMTNTVYVDTLVDLEATADPSVNDNTHFSEYPTQYKYTPVVPVTKGVFPITYHDWPSAGIYYMINDSSYTEVTVVGKGTLLEPYKPMYEDNKYFTRSDISPSYVRRTDTIYYVKETQHRYIWNPTDNEYQRMFVELNDEADLEELTPNKNKAYIILTMNTVQHKIWGKLIQWQEANPIHIPFSHIHGTDPPEYDDSKAINAITASYILSYYASKAISNHPKGYFIDSDNQFHYGPSSSSEIIPANEGIPYEDIATKLLYKYDGSSYKTIDLINGENLTQYDLAPADVNQDGHINAIDASIVLSYYAIRSSGDGNNGTFPASLINDPNTTERDLFAYYLKTYENVEERLTSEYVTMRETDENGSFIPGLDININEHQGLTTVLQGDIKKAVSVKLFDPSAGYETTDKYAYLKRGGLRFTTEGYLSVRVNHLNTYDATSLEGRDASDVNSQDADGNSLENAGTKGLMIYGDNVLGVQLSKEGASDNGELYFDEYGNLRAHATGGGGGELLTITDGTTTMTYNGAEAKTITLGPGLILEPDNP